MNDQSRAPSSASALALHLAGRGFPVFPCNPENKRPLTAHGFKDATTDAATVAAFWERNPGALIGVATGKPSGVFALDLDTDAETGEALGEAWLASVGLADLLTGPGALTPSGGRHIYFRADGLADGLTISAGKAARKVDTRGNGGYIIAPGSVRPDGAYIAANGGLDASSFPALPEALLRALEGKPKAALPFTIDTGQASYRAAPVPADLSEAGEIIGHIPPDCGYGDWVDVLMGLHAHFAGADAALNLADHWSAQGSKYKPGEVAAKWRGFNAGGGTGWPTVCNLARTYGADLSDIARRHKGGASTYGASAVHHGTPAPFPPASDNQDDDAAEFFSAADLDGQPVPPREWHVLDLVPARTVTTLNGDGGTGKSLAALQLATATALGRQWLGMDVTQGRALFISAEDDRDEIHRRLADIARAEGISLADLHNLDLRSLAGKDALLAVPAPKSEVMHETALFHTLDKWIGENKPALTVLDTLADLFGGNEVSRTQARQFVGMLRGLAVRHGTTVLLLAHPSLSGMSSGTGSSGSTAWNNSVRSRLYLRRVAEAEGDEADPDARELEVMKANYSRKGALLPLRWRDGVFHLDAASGTVLDRMAASAKSQRVFLKLLRAFSDQGRYVSAQPGPTYAPAIFARHPDAEGCTKRAFCAAMESLFSAQKIATDTHGQGQKARSHIAIAKGATE